ncbi:MAG TPA: vitamin B12-dependent ribonucleotide reductase [Thermoleophilaceae bacterium]|nr:vitamin B12-dependent ribonucleotide reductase [Thermoleophilaceae bacterium]
MSHSRSAAAPAITATGAGVSVPRRFTEEGVHPFDCIEWEIRDAVIGDPAKPAFEQRGVEFPAGWSQNATNIVAQKYFRGRAGSPERESSVKQMIGRVAETIAGWGREGAYFATDADAAAFEDELTHILLHQMAAFNSPVWFNVGFEESPQASACFILSVEDELESILDWNTKEGRIFRGGSGSGINLSRIRASKEPLSKGGLASGPVSFMRGADDWAGTIKSGGKTRRAAKMVVLDVDHPDVLDFIWCKAREEEKAAALRDAGFDMRLDSEHFASIQYQNANNSVRVTDEFMQRAERGEEWELTARVDGSPIERVDARELLNQIADAAWRCADPGVQYDTTINEWHTCPNSGRINASNPCSEYMHVDDSACNLASLNLMRFRHPDGSFDVEAFEHAVDVVILAQEIVVGPSSYPTEEIGRNARAFRQLGLGYANLGALLMANGVAYDSDAGRALCGAITALMTGRAYRTSAEVAGAIGPYERYEENADPHMHVMRKHRHAAYELDDSLATDSELLAAARRAWDEAVDVGARNGFRNAQATVLAPTGTISFLMDCDTTGIEPDFSLVKFKELVGGGTMTIVNRTVPLALRTLGYDPVQVAAIEAHLAETGTIVGAPGLRDEHLSVFDVAVGERAISPMGHMRMMAAAQPFLSGAISKTVNLPESVTVEDIAGIYLEGWKLGLKALAIYRDGSKTAQALRTDAGEKKDVAAEAAEAVAIEPARPVRRRMPRERQSLTHKFSIGGHEGYITAGEYDDGTIGEVFLTDVGKEGSTIKGLMNAFATSISIGLQYGVPLETFVRKFAYMRFEPEGYTGNPEIPFAKSMPDYIMRWLASRYGDADLHEELGILTAEVRARKASQEALMRGDTAGPAAQPSGGEEAGEGGSGGEAAGQGGGNGGGREGRNGENGGTKGGGAQGGRAAGGKRAEARTAGGSGAAQAGGDGEAKPPTAALTDEPPSIPARLHGLELGPACAMCGGMMQRTGSCYTCSSCGNNTGCG